MHIDITGASYLAFGGKVRMRRNIDLPGSAGTCRFALGAGFGDCGTEEGFGVVSWPDG